MATEPTPVTSAQRLIDAEARIAASAEALLNNRRRPWSQIRPLIRAGDLDALTDREIYTVAAWALFALAAVITFLLTVITPGPPRTIAISAGDPSGAYHAMALQYREKLQQHGITLEVMASRGSLENIERLRPEQPLRNTGGQHAPVVAGFVQSGTASDQVLREDRIESLASIAYEPIWVFHRLGDQVRRVSDLKGRRIAIGAPGTGVQFAARKLLERSGLSAQDGGWLEIGSDEALNALRAGQAEAIILVAAPDSRTVRSALDGHLDLLDFVNADAYLRHFHWLRKVVLPRGVVDLGKDLPQKDVTLIAASANLVVRADLHPALSDLLLEIATEVHAPAGLTQTLREFPSEQALEFRQSEHSKRYFQNGRPFLRRYLPFWLANLLERIMTGVVPLLAILIPMIKLIPAFFAWRERAQVSRLYAQINRVEDAWRQGSMQAVHALEALGAIEKALDGLDPKSPHLATLYHAKSHLNMLGKRIAEEAALASPPAQIGSPDATL